MTEPLTSKELLQRFLELHKEAHRHPFNVELNTAFTSAYAEVLSLMRPADEPREMHCPDGLHTGEQCMSVAQPPDASREPPHCPSCECGAPSQAYVDTTEMLREVEQTLIELGWHKDRGVLKRVTDVLDAYSRQPLTKSEAPMAKAEAGYPGWRDAIRKLTDQS